MKKIMICAVTLLPLIILLILSVGGVVVSMTSYIYVENVEFVENSIVLQKTGDADVVQKLEVNIFPMRANNKELIFWSSDESVAFVSEDGNLIGRNFGEAYIYVKSKENEAKTSVCKVIVTDDKLHSIKIVDAPETLLYGESQILKVSYLPKEAKNTNLLWSSSDPELISVSPDGEITALTERWGKAVVTVSSETDPSVFDSCEISCGANITGMTIADPSPVVTNNPRYSMPEVKIYPEGSGLDVLYRVSDDTVATVDGSGEVEFSQPGAVIVTAYLKDFEFSVSKKITYAGGYFTSAIFEKAEYAFAYEEYSEASLPIALSLTPSDSDRKHLSFESDNPDVVFVRDGKFYVAGGGKATLSVVAKTYDDNLITATCAVTVTRKAQSLKITDSGAETRGLIITDKPVYNLNVELLPSDCTDKTLTYLCEGAAAVNGGIVTFADPKNGGEAYVTVSADGGRLSERVRIIYIPQNVPRFIVNSGTAVVNAYMPPSYAEQKTVVALIPENADEDFTLSCNGLSCQGAFIVATDKGNFTVEISSGADSYSVELNVIRKVERINVDFSGLIDMTEIPLTEESGRVYTAAKDIKIAYSFYPENCSATEAEINITSDCATYSDKVIRFGGAGEAALSVKADGIELTYRLQSTYLMPDTTVATASELVAEAGDELAFADFVPSVSPMGADVSHIRFSSSAPHVFTVDGTTFSAVGGGEAIVTVVITTASGEIRREVKVRVKQRPQSIELNDNYIVGNKNKITIDNSLFKFLPETANWLTDLQFELISSFENCATLEGGAVVFDSAGWARVRAYNADGVSRIVTYVYSADHPIIDVDFQRITEIEIGKPFVVRLPAAQRTAVEFEEQPLLTDMTLEGAVMRVTAAVGSASDAFSASAVIFGNTYRFKGIVAATDVELKIAESEADKTNSGYVTALSALTLSAAASPLNATYRDIVLSVDNENVAEVTAEGLLSFKKAGEVRVTASLKANPEIKRGISVRSTVGVIEKISAPKVVEHLFDELQADANIVDFAPLITPFPSQINVTAQNTRLIPSDGNAATAEGLKVTALKGGEISIRIEVANGDGTFRQIGETTLSVTRYATSVGINDVSKSGGGIIDIASAPLAGFSLHKGSVGLEYRALPLDANAGTDITVEIISGVDDAVLEGNYLIFKRENSDVTVRYTLLGQEIKTWDVVYRTDNYTVTVNLDAEGDAVAPSRELFGFISEAQNLAECTVAISPEAGTAAEIVKSGEHYRALGGGVFLITVTAQDGTETTKRLIVTERPSALNGAVKDVANDNTAVTLALNGKKHLTASASLKLEFPLSASLIDSDGSAPSLEFASSDLRVASVNQDGLVNFSSAGAVIITVTARGEDYYGAYELSAEYTLESTFGHALRLAASQSEVEIFMDDTANYDISGLISVALPLYGCVDPQLSYSSSLAGVLAVDATTGAARPLASGRATVSVSTRDSSGNTVKTDIVFNVEKYIDGIGFADAEGRRIVSAVTKDGYYRINPVFLSDTPVAPTKTGVVYEVLSGNCTVSSDGRINFGESLGKFVVAVKPVYGGAQAAQLTVIRVANAVTVLRADASVGRLVLNKGVAYFLDAQYRTAACSYDLSLYPDLSIIESYGVFEGLRGASFAFEINGGSTIEIIVTEDVERIELSASAEKRRLTAAGAAADPINLDALYSPKFYPETARDENAPYSINYLIENVTGEAAIGEGNSLIFTKAGEVKITISAGDISEIVYIESTMGYAKSAEWLSDLKFDFYGGAKTLVRGVDFAVYPSDATLDDTLVLSTDANIVGADGLRLTFGGGGKALLSLSSLTSGGERLNVSKTVYVNKSAREIFFEDNGATINYLVSGGGLLLTDYVRLGADDVNLSPYKLRYVSSDPSVLTVSEQGAVAFLKSDSAAVVVVTVINTDGSEGVGASITLKQSGSEIIKIDAQTNAAELKLTQQTQDFVIYPVPEVLCDRFEYTVKSGADVLTTDGEKFTLLKGGHAIVTVTGYKTSAVAASYSAAFSAAPVSDSAVWQKDVEILAHRRAERIETANPQLEKEYLTSKTQIDTLLSIYPVDASFEKQIEITSGDENIARVENGKVVFLRAGRVEITARVKYGAEIEAQRVFVIDGTFDKARSFDVTMNDAPIAAEVILSDVGERAVLSVAAVLPEDFTGTVSAVADNPQAITVEVNGLNVTVIGAGKGTSALEISYGGVVRRINFNVFLKSDRTEILADGRTIDTQISTLSNTVTLSARLYPLGVSDETVRWSASGGASVTSDGMLTLPINGYGEYTVTASASDGGSSASVKIVYLQDISGYGVSYGDASLASNSKVRLEWNETRVVVKLSVLPTNLVGTFDYSKFEVSATHAGLGVTRDGSYLIFDTPSAADSPEYENTVTIKYAGLTDFVFYISRFGVQKVDFGDHDNNLDTQYGLQQMRVFGTRSYYGGLVDYYKLPVNVTPSSLGSKLNWVSSDSRVTVSYADGFAYVYLSNFPGSSPDEIERNDFSKTVTVSATDDGGRVFYSYTFHVVANAVNVFDEAGYVANGNVVLHTNLGGADESLMNKYQPLTATSGIGKSLVYGNGFIVNMYATNATYTKEKTYGTSFGRIYNMYFKGTNYDASKKSYKAAVGYQRAFYCQLSQVFQFAPGANSYTKNTKLVFIKGQGAQIAVDEKAAYYENIVGFDSGFITFDSQVASYYFKGFIDVYNYRNKETLKEVAGGLALVTDSFINQVKKNNARYVYEAPDGYDYINAVVFCKKDGDKMPVHFWNEATQTYEAAEIGNPAAANGLKRAVIKILGIPSYSLWSYPANEDGYPKYTNEFNADGSVNHTYLANLDKKIMRLGGAA